jgi:hypothetical protein
MGPVDCPETSVRNYHYCLRNNPEELISQFYVLFMECFGERLIRKGMWPPRSPYLQLCVVFFCLGGLLRNEVCIINRRTVDRVKNAIRMYRLQCARQNLDVQ